MRDGQLNWHNNNSFDWSQLSNAQGRWQHGQQDGHTGESASGLDGSLTNGLHDGWLSQQHGGHHGDSAEWHGSQGSHDHAATPTPDPVPTPTPPVNGSPDPSTSPDPSSASGDGQTPVPPVVSSPAPGTISDPTTPDSTTPTSTDPGATPADPGPQPTSTPAELTHSTTPIHTTQDGQIIEGLDLYVDSGDAITVSNDNVIIRDCRIHYQDGSGVVVEGAKNVTIENSEIINSSPPDGQNPETSPELYNIMAYQAPDLKVDHVTLRDGSSGIYLLESPNAQLTNLEGYNFHGPFPRGQFVQFDKSDGGSLSNFYVQNDPEHSMPEDVISVYQSPNVHVSQGLIDGNNSVSGVGVMFEGNSQGGTVDHVDAVHQGNGAFSSYSPDVSFDYTRSFDNIDADQGRGEPASDALIWNVSNSGVSIDHSTYTHPANPGNIVWDDSKAVVANVTEAPNAHPMSSPVHNDFFWT
jgi:hypothetical protein